MNFKFGVLYAKDGQLTDDEMFSNGEFFTFSLIVFLIWIKKKKEGSAYSWKQGGR